MPQPSQKSLRRQGFEPVPGYLLHGFLEDARAAHPELPRAASPLDDAYWRALTRVLSARENYVRAMYGVVRSGKKCFAPGHVLEAHHLINHFYLSELHATPATVLPANAGLLAARRACWRGPDVPRALQSAFDLGGLEAVARLLM